MREQLFLNERIIDADELRCQLIDVDELRRLLNGAGGIWFRQRHKR